MKQYFFLFLILTVSTFGIAEAYRGEDYSNTQNHDGSYSFVAGLPKWIFNGEEFVPFIYTNNTVNTATNSVTLQSNGTYSFYKNGVHILNDKILAKYADVSNLNSWTYPNAVNNDTPDISWDGTKFISTKISGAVGQLDYKYVLNNNKWKTQLEATNLSALTTKAFGFDQITDLNSDTIKFGGVTRNLDNFNGTTFSKAFLDANKGKVLELLNGVDFDFDLGYENLYAVTVYDTGVNKSRLVFDYRTSVPLLPNEKLVIDPSFSSTTVTSSGRVISTSTTGSACSTTYSSSDAVFVINKAQSDDNSNCQALFINFDVSSITVPVHTISNASIQYEVAVNINSTFIDWKHLNFTASGNEATYDALTQDVGDIVDIGTNTTAVDVSAGLFDQFTSNATSRFINDLNNDRVISIGMFYQDLSRIPTKLIQNQFTGAVPRLFFTYLTTPDTPYAITTLTNSTNPTATTIGLNWTAPTIYEDQVIIGYQINVTTPQTDNPTIWVNDTGTATPNWNVTGLLFGTDYSARVSAWTNNTGHPFNNVTGANIFNFTTSSNTWNSPPTNFLMLPNGSSTSILNLNWAAPVIDNINGYRIQCEAPVGGGFSTVVSNTTTAGTSYNRTGLSVNTYYNCKVAGLNGSGITDYSNTYSQTTYHLPDAVDDLVATPTDIIDIVITFSQPDTLYGYLTGYNINYTTPQSNDPLTVYVETTSSSDVSYTLTGLDTSEDYSFRVSAITIHGKNVTGGLVANATTFSNFEVGSIAVPTGVDSTPIPIDIEEVVINSTTSDIVVTYDSSYALSCDLDYMFGNSNQTYTGLTENAISGSRVYSNFTLNGINNDIIDIHCWDTLDLDTEASDRVGQSNGTVPLFDQISSFQDGAFGTTGKFGALDLMTLIIVIVSMIGFNRDHPEVGVAIMGTMMGVCYFYGIIQWETGLTGAVILVVALAIANSKRGSSN